MAHEVWVLRSTLGSLKWVSCCVPVGRLYKAVLKPVARADLLWWKDFLEAAVADKTLARWAGVDMPLPHFPVVRLFSDVSATLGSAALPSEKSWPGCRPSRPTSILGRRRGKSGLRCKP